MNALKKLLSLVLALSLACGVVSTSFVAMAAEEAAASSEYEELLSSYLDEIEDEEEAETDADTSETEPEEDETPADETEEAEESTAEADQTVSAAEDSSGETDDDSDASSDENTIVDTSALETKIAEAEDLSESDYTAATWATLQTALTAAQTVLATEGVTQTEVDAALSDLTAAIDALVSYQDIYDSSTKISLEYDDRYTFSYKVTSIVSLTITSKRVGSSKSDTAVAEVDSSNSKKIIACGCGTAVITLSNGKTYGIKVSAAPISLLLIIGQSNAEGRPSSTSSSSLSTYKKQWIPSEEGQVYSTYAPSDTSMYSKIGWYSATGKNGLTTSNESAFIPASLPTTPSGYA
ncbi:MAG: FIVAR domain-containing protein, partial [Clostridiales bacterium]|nr:FIVAR domain-containing protein [Clostridiales bacterium]